MPPTTDAARRGPRANRVEGREEADQHRDEVERVCVPGQHGVIDEIEPVDRVQEQQEDRTVLPGMIDGRRAGSEQPIERLQLFDNLADVRGPEREEDTRYHEVHDAVDDRDGDQQRG